MKRAILLSLLSVLMLPCLALASTISYDATPEILDTQTDWAKTVYFQQFDSTFGILNSITISMTSTGNTTLSVENTGSQKSSGTASTQLTISLSDPGSILYSITGLPATLTFNNLVAGGTATTNLVNFNVTNTETYTLASVLKEFTGAGLVALTAEAIAYTLVGYSGGNIASTQITYAGLTGTITYDYTPTPPHTPEPTTLLLMGSGLAGMVFARRRRGKSRV